MNLKVGKTWDSLNIERIENALQVIAGVEGHVFTPATKFFLVSGSNYSDPDKQEPTDEEIKLRAIKTIVDAFEWL